MHQPQVPYKVFLFLHNLWGECQGQLHKQLSSLQQKVIYFLVEINSILLSSLHSYKLIYLLWYLKLNKPNCIYNKE